MTWIVDLIQITTAKCTGIANACLLLSVMCMHGMLECCANYAALVMPVCISRILTTVHDQAVTARAGVPVCIWSDWLWQDLHHAGL